MELILANTKVKMQPALVEVDGKDMDYIAVTFLETSLFNQTLVIGSFEFPSDESDMISGDIKFDAFFANVDENKSNEMIADNVDIVKLIAFSLVERAVSHYATSEETNGDNDGSN